MHREIPLLRMGIGASTAAGERGGRRLSTRPGTSLLKPDAGASERIIGAGASNAYRIWCVRLPVRWPSACLAPRLSGSCGMGQVEPRRESVDPARPRHARIGQGVGAGAGNADRILAVWP
jgi:hypothetical protein